MDLQLKTTSGDVACSIVESGTPENIGIAVGITLIAALRTRDKLGVILSPVTKNGCKKSLPLEG